MPEKPRPRLGWKPWAYIVALVALGAVTLYEIRPEAIGDQWLSVLAFSIIIFTTEAMPVDLPGGGGTVSVGFAMIFATILSFDPGTAVWLAALATLRVREVSGQIGIEKVLFNRSQLAVSAAAAALTYQTLGGSPGQMLTWGSVIPMLAAAGVYSVVNIATVVGVLSLVQGVPFWRIWFTDFKWMVPHYLALTPLGVVIAIVQASIGLAGVLLLFVPLVLARYSLQLYAQMRKAYLATIQAMVAAIEARDPYTAGHSRRVAEYAVATARLLRMPEEQIERLEYSAWLHDVGKLAIPDHILQKRGPLTTSEWNYIKRHPETGANILRQIKLLGKDVDVILHHHERWDGEGYPSMLKGTEIPVGARLIAIADSYEAMTSARPYRPQLNQEQALTELKRCAGTQFDPGLVDIFERAAGGLEGADAAVDSVPQLVPQNAVADLAVAETAASLDQEEKHPSEDDG